MTPTFDDPKKLADFLKELLTGSPRPIVGIDGDSGAGKSTLAGALAQRLAASHISVDDYVEPTHQSHLQRFRIPEIRKAVATAGARLILDSVCLLYVAQEAELALSSHVYVKRVTSGIWLKAEALSQRPETVEKFIREEDERLSFLAQPDDPPPDTRTPLHHDILRYHAKYHPSEVATAIFENRIRRVP